MAMVLFGEVVKAEEAKELGIVWKVVDDATLVDDAVALAAVAAGQGKELNARTKASILTLDTVSESDAAVDHELWPQLWSMDQGDFRDLVARLQQNISSKG
jgi:enoyl-CoA hydratase/carnithine racemase